MMFAIKPRFFFFLFWSRLALFIDFFFSRVVSPARDRTAEIEQLQRDLAHARAAHEQSRAAYEAELLRCGETVSHLSFLLLLLSIFSLSSASRCLLFAHTDTQTRTHSHSLYPSPTYTHSLPHLDELLAYCIDEMKTCWLCVGRLPASAAHTKQLSPTQNVSWMSCVHVSNEMAMVT